MFGTGQRKLTADELQILLIFARQTITAKLDEQARPQFAAVTGIYCQRRGVFITLIKEQNLRGCIGSLSADQLLPAAVAEAAESAAFSDPRFPALSRGELPLVLIELSILSPAKRVNSVNEIEVCKHGVVLKLGTASGLLLPQVAERQKWTSTTLLEHACFKAGLDKGSWKNRRAELMVFEAQICRETGIIN